MLDRAPTCGVEFHDATSTRDHNRAIVAYVDGPAAGTRSDVGRHVEALGNSCYEVEGVNERLIWRLIQRIDRLAISGPYVCITSALHRLDDNRLFVLSNRI